MSSRHRHATVVDGEASLAAGVPSVEAHGSGSPFRILHRHLRGRYRWALPLALLGVVGGAYAGWRSQEPLYLGEGIIYIAPSMPSPQDPAGQTVLPMFRGFVAYQVYLLNSPNATHLAMGTDAWQETGEGASPEAIQRFVERRSIVHDPDTQHVQVQFLDANPAVAVAGVRALIQAYEKLSEVENARDNHLKFATTQTEVLTAQLKDRADQILRLSAEFGGVEGLEIRHRASVTQVLSAEEELGKLQSAIRNHKEQTGPGVPNPATEKSADEIAVESPQLATQLLQLQMLEGQAELLAKTMGEKNDRLVAMRMDIEVLSRWVKKYVDEWNRRLMDESSRRVAPTRSDALTLDEANARAELLSKRLEALRKESQALGAARVEIRALQTEIEDLGRRLDQMKALKDQLSSQLVGKGRITITVPDRPPTTPFKDRRKSAAAIGGILGGGLGVLIVLFFGLRDRRFRSSEDVGTSLSNLRLLGLMPALPPDLMDPQSGEMAAHCVHQIRTLLQIGHSRDQRGCFCITGPGVGSGKTTLSLALGLSFGRSGTRTLLIDADLAGRGLTWRVGQMLLSHARRVAGEIESPPAGTMIATLTASDSAQLLGPCATAGDRSDRSSPGELAELLGRAAELKGLEAVRASGLLGELFALADLRFPGEGRAALMERIASLLRAADPSVVGASGDWSVPPHLELDRSHPEFNGVPLDRYLFPTGSGSLQFLPLRGLGAGGGVSVATITRILARVREEFDVVLVDTGPVLGAVETPIVAAQTDSVVLVVSPDDHRPDAERAASQLQDVGARVAGVVFNRAAAKDVLRSSRSHSGLDDPKGAA